MKTDKVLGKDLLQEAQELMHTPGEFPAGILSVTIDYDDVQEMANGYILLKGTEIYYVIKNEVVLHVRRTSVITPTDIDNFGGPHVEELKTLLPYEGEIYIQYFSDDKENLYLEILDHSDAEGEEVEG